MNIDVVPADGPTVQKIVADMYATPPSVIKKVKEALERAK